MEQNNTKNITKIEEDMQSKLKSVLIEFKKSEQDIADEVVEIRSDFQNRINNMSKCNLAILNERGEIVNDILSLEMQQELKDQAVKKLKFQERIETNRLKEELEKAREKANKECKSIFDEAKEQLEKKVTDQREELDEVSKKIKQSYQDVSQIEAVIKFSKLKPENRAFKALDEDKKNIIQERKELQKRQKEAERQINISETELQEFNNKYERVDFESENSLELLIDAMYEISDQSSLETILQVENDLNAEHNSQKEDEQEEDNPPEKDEQEGDNAPEKDGQEGNNPPEKAPQGDQKKDEQGRGKKNPQGTQKKDSQSGEKEDPQGTQKKDSQSGEEKDTQGNQKKDEQNEKKKEPKMIYEAKKDRYIIITPESEKPLGLSRTRIEKMTEEDIAELGIIEEDLENGEDINAVIMWKLYDNTYGTNETDKYLTNILNPEKNRRTQMEYDLTGIYKNKEMTEKDRQRILDYANEAKDYQIATVKKGFRVSTQEAIESRLGFIKSVRQQRENFNIGNIFNKIKNINLRRIASNKAMENISNSSIKEEEPTERRRREKRFKKETTITREFDQMSKEISEASNEDIDKILERAKEDLIAGKISKTEYSGLAYNASNRRNALNNPEPEEPGEETEKIDAELDNRG